MHDFRRLEVWHDSVAIAKATYSVTEKFPASEVWGLTAQLRRAVISVSSNIAEGAGRSSTREFRRFLSMARGSLFEVDSQLEVARQLGYLEDAGGISEQLGRLGRRLSTLMATLGD
jgi:four helix bundle protein